jgi:hypothetical protein
MSNNGNNPTANSPGESTTDVATIATTTNTTTTATTAAPTIDFTVHYLEDGTQVSTTSRVVSGK